MIYYAHTGDTRRGISCQSYSKHVFNVIFLTEKNARRVLKNSNIGDEKKQFFLDVVALLSRI